MLGTLLVGGGPAGIGLLLASRRNGSLQRMLADGLKILERSTIWGQGDIGRYAIRSDSFADSFLRSASETAEPNLQQVLRGPAGTELVDRRGGPVNLRIASEFLGDLAEGIRIALPRDIFASGVEALESRQTPVGLWLTSYRDAAGNQDQVVSRNLVLATGGEEASDRLRMELIAGEPLLPRFGHKTVPSSQVLTEGGAAGVTARLVAHRRPRVAIVGGSHSALASAMVLLDQCSEIRFGADAVTILHRSPLRITYRSPDEAVADGYSAFAAGDICTKSGRVFPLAGFRADARQLLRRVWGLGGEDQERRIRLLRLDASAWPEANQILNEADLIISALGYRPRALRLVNAEGTRIDLAPDAGASSLVDERSRVLDAHRRPVPGVFAMGLAAGYPMAGTHGEPSFRGQANGLALWQGEIGAQIADQLVVPSLASSRISHDTMAAAL